MTIWHTIAIATASMVLGTLGGSRALARIPDLWFHRVLAAVLAGLGAAMVVRGLSKS